MELKSKQWTTQKQRKGENGKSRSSFIIMYVKDNNVKKLISLTVGEHLRQFGDLLKEAGYSYVSFDSLDVDSIFQL
jgi:hypothetical protein